MGGHDRDVGARIKAARVAKGMTQAALARAIGEGGHSTVSQWENGRTVPSDALVTFARIAAVLGTTPAYLMFGEGTAKDFVRVAVVDAPSFADEDAETWFGLPASSAVRSSTKAWRLPRDGMLRDAKEGDFVFFDEGDRTIGPSPARFMSGGQDPTVVDACLCPGNPDEVIVTLGGLQATVRKASLPLLGKVVGMAVVGVPA